MFLYFLGIDVKYNVFQWSKDKEYIKSACLYVTYTTISIQYAYKNQCSSILQFLQAPSASYFFRSLWENDSLSGNCGIYPAWAFQSGVIAYCEAILPAKLSFSLPLDFKKYLQY